MLVATDLAGRGIDVSEAVRSRDIHKVKIKENAGRDFLGVNVAPREIDKSPQKRNNQR